MTDINTDVDYIERELSKTRAVPADHWPPPVGVGHLHNAYARLESLRTSSPPTPTPPIQPPHPEPTPPQGDYPTPPGAMVASTPMFFREIGNLLTQGRKVTAGSSDGIANMVWTPKPSTGLWTVEDCEADNIAASPPRSSDGRAEAGFWFGQKTDAKRFVAKNNAWMGIWTGCMVDGSTFSDFDLSGNPHVAAYLEHITSHCLFKRFFIHHTGDGNAVNMEWWYQDSTYGKYLNYGGKAGSYANEFQDFEIYVPAGKWAFYLDAGSFANKIAVNGGKCKIYGPGNGIAHPKNLMDPKQPNQINWSNIDTSGLTGTKEYQHSNAIG